MVGIVASLVGMAGVEKSKRYVVAGWCEIAAGWPFISAGGLGLWGVVPVGLRWCRFRMGGGGLSGSDLRLQSECVELVEVVHELFGMFRVEGENVHADVGG